LGRRHPQGAGQARRLREKAAGAALIDESIRGLKGRLN
jgi:hypothetical protein